MSGQAENNIGARSRTVLRQITRSVDRLPEATVAQVMLVPVYLFVVLGLGFPVVYSFVLSFFDVQPARVEGFRFVGLANYVELLSDRQFRVAVPASLIFTFGSVALSILIALGVALSLRATRKGQGIYRTILLVPWAVPPVVNAWMWLWMFNQNYGAVNAALEGLGVISSYVNWFSRTDTAFLAIIVAAAWKAFPFLTLLLLAKLLTIPRNLLHAGRIDGASGWQCFRYIIVPAIQPTLIVVVLLQTMWSLKEFSLVYVMTRGQPRDTTAILNYMVYREAFEFRNRGYASAAAWVLAGMIALLTVAYVSRMRDISDTL